MVSDRDGHVRSRRSARRWRSLLTALVVGTTVGVASAASPALWTLATQAGFLAGEVDGIAVTENGRLRLGLTSNVVYEGTMPALWTLHADGTSLLGGTGNQGHVVQVDARGESRVLVDVPELEFHAIATAPGQPVYAGSSPDGRVYRVERNAPGKFDPFFDPAEKYIWAMTLAPDGTLYVGTGDPGRVYRVGRDGAGTMVFDSKAKNVTALAWARSGELLVGTESPARLFRVNATGRGFLLLDATQTQVSAIHVAPSGDTFVAALSGGGTAAPAESSAPEPVTPIVTTSASVSTEITITAIGDASTTATTASTPPSREPRRGAKGVVYRLGADGLADAIWESSEDTPYALADGPNGDLLVGTGNNGKLFQLSPATSRSTLLARLAVKQVTAIANVADATYVATANPAKIVRLGRTPAERGTYLSPVKDAGSGAVWGQIRWRATTPSGATVELSTRSGNTATPDDTWSEWTGPYAAAAGTSVSSPNARYLQWRAVLAGKTSPEITSVVVSYLPRNARPRVTSLTVHPPGVAFFRPFPAGDPELAGFDSPNTDDRVPLPSAVAQASATSAGLGRRTYQKGIQVFAWQADDDNNDRLTYALYYRREGDADWRLLRRDIFDTIFTWDTTSVSDGLYSVKLVATDASANPDARALTGERESELFQIDNTAPTVEITNVRIDGTRLRGSVVVRDGTSMPERVEISTDASRWQALYPVDGVADGREERYDLDIASEGAATILVRATDSLNNVGTATATVSQRTPPQR